MGVLVFFVGIAFDDQRQTEQLALTTHHFCINPPIGLCFIDSHHTMVVIGYDHIGTDLNGEDLRQRL